MAELAGKVAIVTGANLRGDDENIGSATAALLASEGAAVVAADIDADGAERVADRIRADGGRAISCGVDIASEDQVRAMVERTVAEFGGIDVLHNNAAAMSTEDIEPVTMAVDVWDRMMAVNTRGAMLCCKYAIPVMIARGGGSIINTSSGSGLSGDVHRIAYGSSKAAVNMFTKYVATLYGKSGIRCNALAPGLTLSSKAKESISAEGQAMYLRHTLMPRLGEPADLANAVLFLASDRSSFITGQVIAVDGGLNSHRPFVAEIAPWARSG
jgi:NAD(P)-dependent dehydrogenase (short-subunit alcohol dehydrogenase family)